MWFKEGAGKLKFVATELTYWAQQGVEFVALELWIDKNHSEDIATFDIEVQWAKCSAERLALQFFPSTVRRSLELWQWKN